MKRNRAKEQTLSFLGEKNSSITRYNSRRVSREERQSAARSIEAMRNGAYQGELLRKEGYSVENKKKWTGIFIAFSALILFGTLLFYGGMKIYMVVNGNFLSQHIERVHVKGCRVVPNNLVRNAVQIIEQQTKMSEIDSDFLEKKIEQIAWVKSAKVKKRWDATVTITIKEVQAVALMAKQDKDGQHLYYMDSEGNPFLPVKPGEMLDLPVVTGLSYIKDKKQRQKSLSDVKTFLERLQRNNPQLPAQSLSEIHITKTGELVVYLVEYPFPIFFGNGKIKTKYNRLVQVLKPFYKKQRDGKREIGEISYIQLEYITDKILVAMTDDIREDKSVEKPKG